MSYSFLQEELRATADENKPRARENVSPWILNGFYAAMKSRLFPKGTSERKTCEKKKINLTREHIKLYENSFMKNVL